MIHNLFILGSPRRNGNSETMARIVAEYLSQTPLNGVDYIHTASLNISPCVSCGGCSKTGKCIIDDDMAPLYEKIDAADRIFFVSPVYFYAMSAQIKTFIDRCQALWSRRYLLGKRHPQKAHRTGHLLSCAATGGDQIFTGSTLTIKCLCDTLDLHYSPPLLIKDIDSADDLAKNPEKIAACKTYGENIVSGS